MTPVVQMVRWLCSWDSGFGDVFEVTCAARPKHMCDSLKVRFDEKRRSHGRMEFRCQCH